MRLGWRQRQVGSPLAAQCPSRRITCILEWDRERGKDEEVFLELCSAARSMGMTGVNITFIQETKIVNLTFEICSFAGYSILVAAADNNRRHRRRRRRRGGGIFW